MGEGKSPCPKSLFYELMDFTVELAKSFQLSPFEILKQEKDHVIMMINYYSERGQESETSAAVNNSENKRARGKNDRVRVNDKTATGGWF